VTETDHLTGAIRQLESQRDAYQTQVAALDSIISQLRNMTALPTIPLTAPNEAPDNFAAETPNPPFQRHIAPPDPNAPRGQEAVMRILMEKPGEWIRFKELVAEMKHRRWTEAERDEAIRTSADRLSKKDPRVEKKRGFYRFAPDARAGENDPETPEGGESTDDDSLDI
jgi:hypothetical protein